MKHQVITLASGLLLLAGCAVGPQVTGPGKAGTLVLTPEFRPGSFQLLAMPALEPYQEKDVNRLIVRLYALDNGVETPVDENSLVTIRTLTRPHLADPVVFTHLKPNTTYRAKSEAYGLAEYHVTAPVTEILISTGDAESTTDIVVTDDDRPTAGKLKVRLKARPFSGEGEFGVDVENGKLIGGGSEELTDAGPAN